MRTYQLKASENGPSFPFGFRQSPTTKQQRWRQTDAIRSNHIFMVGGGGGEGVEISAVIPNRFNLLSTQKSNRKWIEFKKNSKKANVSFH